MSDSYNHFMVEVTRGLLILSSHVMLQLLVCAVKGVVQMHCNDAMTVDFIKKEQNDTSSFYYHSTLQSAMLKKV